MNFSWIKRAQESEDVWISAGFERLFTSRAGIADPKYLQEIMILESSIINTLQADGLMRNSEWRITENAGFEINSRSILATDEEILESFRAADRNLVTRFGRPSNLDSAAPNEVYIDFQNNPKFSHYVGDFLFHYPSSATAEENEIRRMYSLRFTKALEKAGLERNVDWALGPEEETSGWNLPSSTVKHVVRRVYYRQDDEDKMKRFESIFTIFDAETRKVLRAYEAYPDIANKILGKETTREIGDEISSATLASLRRYIFNSKSPFSEFNLSSLSAEEIGKLGNELKKMEKEGGFAFSGLDDVQKKHTVRDVLFHAGVVPGYVPAFFPSDNIVDFEGFFNGFISKLSKNRHLFTLFKNLAGERKTKAGDFSGLTGADTYERLVAMNQTDALKVDSVIAEAYYDIYRPSGSINKDDAKKMLAALFTHVLFEVLRGYRNKVRYRPVEGNSKLDEEKRKRYYGLVEAVLGGDGLMSEEWIFGVVDSIHGDIVAFVHRYPTVKSLAGTAFMRDILGRIYSGITRIEQK